MKLYKRMISLILAFLFVFCSFSVSAEKVDKSFIIKNVKDGVRLRWSKSEKSPKYKIYRSTEKNKGYKLLTTTKSLSYTDKTAKAGKTYFYKVKGSKDKTAKKNTIVRLNAPVLKSAKLGEDLMVMVKWTKVKGAKTYGVYRAKVREGKPDKYNYIFSTSNNHFLDDVMFAGKYKYRIKAENGYYESVASNSLNFTYTENIEQSTIVSILNEDYSGVKLLFNKSGEATGYKIYRSVNNGGYYRLIADIPAEDVQDAEGILALSGIAQYTDTTVEEGKTYLYAIETYNSFFTSKKMPAFDTITYNKADVVMKVGDTNRYLNRRFNIFDTLLGRGGSEDFLKLFDLEYSTEDTDIISINEKNIITALSEGTATINVTYKMKIEGFDVIVSEKLRVLVKPKS